MIVSKNINNILRKVVLNIALAASLSSVAAILHAGGTNVPKHDSKQIKCIVDMVYHESRSESTKGMVATVFVGFSGFCRVLSAIFIGQYIY